MRVSHPTARRNSDRGGVPHHCRFPLATAHRGAHDRPCDGRRPKCNGSLDVQGCGCTAPNVDCTRNPTQGAYSCLDDGRTVSTVTDTFQNKKISVFVADIGSTERAEFLHVFDAMAVAERRAREGMPKHYIVQTAQELRAALPTSRDSIAKCTYLTPSAPSDPNAITVDIDDRQIPRDSTHQNGWDWINLAYGEIAFFGSARTAAGATQVAVTGVVMTPER